MKMKCWDKIMTPMRKIWAKLSKKLGLRKNAGHKKLQQDVRTCEYEDVHVLWEMLKQNEKDLAGSGGSDKKGMSCFLGVCSMGKAHPFDLPCWLNRVHIPPLQ